MVRFCSVLLNRICSAIESQNLASETHPFPLPSSLPLCISRLGWGSIERDQASSAFQPLTRSYDLVVWHFDVFSGFISGFIFRIYFRIGGVGGSSWGWFFSMFLVSFFFINFS